MHYVTNQIKKPTVQLLQLLMKENKKYNPESIFDFAIKKHIKQKEIHKLHGDCK